METRDLPPGVGDSGSDKLTVSLWLAGRAAADKPTDANARKLERIE